MAESKAILLSRQADQPTNDAISPKVLDTHSGTKEQKSLHALVSLSFFWSPTPFSGPSKTGQCQGDSHGRWGLEGCALESFFKGMNG